MFHYLGLILVLVSWIGGVYLVRHWRGNYAMSISQHAASAKGASKLFAVILGGGSILFYWWLLQWYAPHFKLGPVFVAILVFTGVSQFIVGIVPDIIGWRHHVHQTLAVIMAACYSPLTYLILRSSELHIVARIVALLFIIIAIVAGLIFFSVKRARNYYLIFQSIYIVAFQLIILSTGYL